MDMDLRETPFSGLLVSGFAMIAFTFLLLPAVVIVSMILWIDTIPGLALGLSAPAFVLFVLGCKGYFTLEPNEACVMIFFGRYVGTCRKVGFYWANPFLTRRKLSLRLRNMDIDPIKVNDLVGNPVLIGMVLVWRLRDTYRAVFDVDGHSSLEEFVRIQSDAALREVTGQYAYDDDGTSHHEHHGDHDHDHGDHRPTLRSSGAEISALLEHKINERVAMAGIEVIEARINYLAYAPEIAAVMLRRQQASAILAAREKIVEGAVTMVKMALDRIAADHIAEFTPEGRAQMVSNLLMVLCSDEPAQPVLNAAQ